MQFENVYEDSRRAESYARLEFPGTYYLAYRDLPELIKKYVNGKTALDFGCGTGRSTRFLKQLSFAAVGIDISNDMLRQARLYDKDGEYYHVPDGDLSLFKNETFDLILSAFTFDNISTKEKKLVNLAELKRVLKPDGKMVNLVSSPDIYIHEWASFSTKDYPENRKAKSGDKVKIVMTDVDDQRPVEDILWTDDAYRENYRSVGLKVIEIRKPLGRLDEPFEWINETKIPPWVIYILSQ